MTHNVKKHRQRTILRVDSTEKKKWSSSRKWVIRSSFTTPYFFFFFFFFFFFHTKLCKTDQQEEVEGQKKIAPRVTNHELW
mmetsp:Transcript_28182/g.48899  ORF Transcript_28182/g.48899 Transcript_28182/m.48899 type:complete len:81 (-) Transcript_28182:52-294(-)